MDPASYRVGTQELKNQRCSRGRSSVPLVSKTQHLRYFFYHSLSSSFSQYYVVADSKAITLLAKKLHSWCVELVFLRGARSTADVREAMSNSSKFMISLELTIDSRLVQDCKSRKGFTTLLISSCLHIKHWIPKSARISRQSGYKKDNSQSVPDQFMDTNRKQCLQQPSH